MAKVIDTRNSGGQLVVLGQALVLPTSNAVANSAIFPLVAGSLRYNQTLDRTEYLSNTSLTWLATGMNEATTTALVNSLVPPLANASVVALAPSIANASVNALAPAIANASVNALAPAIANASVNALAPGIASSLIANNVANTSLVWAGTNNTNSVTSANLTGSAAPQVLTDQANITWDANSGYNAKVTLGGDRTLTAITNPKVGVTYVLQIIQGSPGTRLLTWNACYEFGSAGTPTLSTTTGKNDFAFMYCYDAATPKFRVSFSKDS